VTQSLNLEIFCLRNVVVVAAGGEVAGMVSRGEVVGMMSFFDV